LANTFVHNDKGDLWTLHHGSVHAGLTENAVLFGDDSVELIKLKINNLLSHRVSNTITVDKDMCRHLSVIKFTVGLERSLEIITKYS